MCIVLAKLQYNCCKSVEKYEIWILILFICMFSYNSMLPMYTILSARNAHGSYMAWLIETYFYISSNIWQKREIRYDKQVLCL